MIYVILGTKAQIIKMAPVMKEMDRRGIGYRYYSTGQHQETMKDLHADFGVREPDASLVPPGDVVTFRGMALWLLRLTGKMFCRDKKLFPPSENRLALVHGDTASTLIGAIVGKRNGCRIGHVESGLYSGRLFDPFPEEAIRRMAFRLADILFCPGEWAMGNVRDLAREVVNTGANTLADSLKISQEQALEPAPLPFPMGQPFGVVSIHRTENITTRQQVRRIVDILEEISESYPLLVVMHKTTENALQRRGLLERIEMNPNIRLSPRYRYFDFVSILKRAAFVISDGGSNQEECAYLGKPLLLLRRRTERIEGLGQNCIVSGYDRDEITTFIRDHSEYAVHSDNAKASPSALIVDYCIRFV